MPAFKECPLCGALVLTEDLEEHVQQELAHQEGQEGPGASGCPASSNTGVRCERCGQDIPLGELDSHLLAHELQAPARADGSQHQQQQKTEVWASEPGAAPAAPAARCDHCAQHVPLAEFDSHLLAHEMQNGDTEAADALAAAAAAEEGDAAELERLAFEELRQRFGFAEKPSRPGACHLCGEPGHWVRDCPSNPDVQAAKARVLPHPTPDAVLATQRPATQPEQPSGGLIGRLAELLEQQHIPPGTQYQAALCAPGVVHYAAEPRDAGWGCGYRNAQMLAGHLLAMGSRPEARAVLFGGAGLVPDIPDLQAWLEVAWAAGFDRQGCEQLGGCVQGTHKWIGTTEAATLLRYWGLRAMIADFGVDAQTLTAQRSALAAAAAAAGSSGQDPGTQGQQQGVAVEVHAGVECDGCGSCPLLGPRYKSESKNDFDLCAKCYQAQGGPAAAAAPFRRMLASRCTIPLPAVTQQGECSMQDKLMQWVWRHFTVGPGKAEPASALPPSSAQGTPAAAGVAAESDNGEPAEAKRPKLGQPGQRRVHTSSRPALYFQHEGHSRTIIGIERRLVGRERREEFTLLVLDPGTKPAALAAALAQGQGWQRLLKRGLHTLRHRTQYQVLWVEPGLATGDEMEAMKLVAASERH